MRCGPHSTGAASLCNSMQPAVAAAHQQPTSTLATLEHCSTRNTQDTTGNQCRAHRLPPHMQAAAGSCNRQLQHKAAPHAAPKSTAAVYNTQGCHAAQPTTPRSRRSTQRNCHPVQLAARHSMQLQPAPSRLVAATHARLLQSAAVCSCSTPVNAPQP